MWVWVLLLVGVVLLMSRTRTVIGYVNGKAVELELRHIGDGHHLRVDAAAAFLAMRSSALRDGVSLFVNSSFRSMERQTALHEQYLAGNGPLAAKPGYSNHQGGTAVDVETGAGTNSAFKWMTANALRFGYRRTVASEPWHWEYRA